MLKKSHILLVMCVQGLLAGQHPRRQAIIILWLACALIGSFTCQAGVDLILSSNSTMGGNFTLSLPGATLSGSGDFCAVSYLPETHLRVEVGRTYTVAADSCCTYLSFVVPDCYQLRVDGVVATGMSLDRQYPIGLPCHVQGNGTTNWQIQLRHTNDLSIEFDVPRIDDHYVLSADGVSMTHPSIKRLFSQTGLTPPVTWSIISQDSLDCQIDPTNGTVRAGERPGTITVQAANASCRVIEELELRRCQACVAGDCTIGTVDAETGSASVRIHLGQSARGEPAGDLTIYATNSSANLGAVALLRYNFWRNDVEVITNASGVIRQVKTPQGLADIPSPGLFGYLISFYPLSAVGAKTNGVYRITGAAFRSVSISGSGGNGQLTVNDSIQTRHFSASGNEWDLSTGIDSKVEKKTTTYSETNTLRTVVYSILDSHGQTNFTSTRAFRKFPWGEVLASETIGSGASARTSTYTYTSDGRRRDTVLADGSWQIEFFDAARRVTNLFAALGDQLPTTNRALCRFVESIYDSSSVLPGSGDPGYEQTNIARRITEYWKGIEVSRRYNAFILATSERREIVCLATNAAWNDPSNLVTSTFTYGFGTTNYGLLKSIAYPDGTQEIHEYFADRLIHVVSRGHPSGGTIDDGTRTITITDPVGNLLSRTNIDILSGLTTSVEIYSDPDDYGRPRLIIYLDGTSTYTTYGCCGPDTVTSREGVMTTFSYDDLRRRVTESANGVTNATIYDAADNVVALSRRAPMEASLRT